MRRFRMLAALLALLGSSTAAGQAGVVTVFAQLSPQAGIPAGIATDFAGNVIVSSDTFVATNLTAYDPNGVRLAQRPFQNILSVGPASHLAIEPNSGRLANLQADGTVVLLDGATGQVTPVFSFRELPTDVSRIFDIQTNTIRNATGVIQPQFATYGDIAVLTRGGTIDVFATGYHGALAFVTRARFAPGQLEPSAQVLVSSSGPLLAGTPINEPRGVAVNQLGVVVTSLPVGNTNVSLDRAVAFSADFPEGLGFAPVVALPGIELPSRGMASDLQGNFYITTGPFASSLCPPGVRGLIRVMAATGLAECFTIAGATVDANDVAVAPSGDAAYVVMRSDGAILRVQLR
jgi:hypothetical protein